MTKVVLFDIDGTLGDTLALYMEVLRRCAIEARLPVPTDEDIFRVFGFSDADTLGNLLGLPYDSPELPMSTFLFYYTQLHPLLAPKPYNGIPEVLAAFRARGVRLGVVTSKDRAVAVTTLRQYQLLDFFEYLACGDPSGNRKAEGIRHALDRFHVHTSDVVYVGDTASDIEVSHQAGVKVVSAAWSSTGSRYAKKCLACCPDYRLGSISELLRVV